MGFLNELFSAGVWGEKTPAAPKWKKWIHRNLSDNHCPECLMLDSCWFLKEKTPIWPHHPFCHCVLEDIPYNDVVTNSSSNSAYSKFDPYLFDTKGEYGHGKDKLFKSWGYSVEDAKYLKAEIEKLIPHLFIQVFTYFSSFNTIPFSSAFFSLVTFLLDV